MNENKGYITAIWVDTISGSELQQVILYSEEDPLYDIPIRGTGGDPSASYKFEYYEKTN